MPESFHSLPHPNTGRTLQTGLSNTMPVVRLTHAPIRMYMYQSTCTKPWPVSRYRYPSYQTTHHMMYTNPYQYHITGKPRLRKSLMPMSHLELSSRYLKEPQLNGAHAWSSCLRRMAVPAAPWIFKTSTKPLAVKLTTPHPRSTLVVLYHPTKRKQCLMHGMAITAYHCHLPLVMQQHS